MSFQGDVRGIGLAELLQGLARGRKEGSLTLTAKGGLRCVIGIEDGKAWLMPDPDEDPDTWRARVRDAWADDEEHAVDIQRLQQVARASRTEVLYALLDGGGVHFRFEPGTLPERTTRLAEDGHETTVVHCPPTQVEFVLLEYARVADELESRGAAADMAPDFVPCIQDLTELNNAPPDLVEQCNGNSTVQEIADRLGWPLRQARLELARPLAQGGLRLAHHIEVLGLALYELQRKQFNRAGTRLSLWTRISPPGPFVPEDAEALSNEWLAGRLTAALRTMRIRDVRCILRRLDHSLGNPNATLVHWTEAARMTRMDRIVRLKHAAAQLRAEGEDCKLEPRDLLDLARDLRDHGSAWRSSPALTMAAFRQPQSNSQRLELGMGFVAAKRAEDAGPWVVTACAEILNQGHADRVLSPLRQLLELDPRNRDARQLLTRAKRASTRTKRLRRNILIGGAIIASAVGGAFVKVQGDRQRQSHIAEAKRLLNDPVQGLATLDAHFAGDASPEVQDIRRELEERLRSVELQVRAAWLDEYHTAQQTARSGDPLLVPDLLAALPKPPKMKMLTEAWPDRNDVLIGLVQRLETEVTILGAPSSRAPQQLATEQRVREQAVALKAKVLPAEAASKQVQEYVASLDALLELIERRDEARSVESFEQERRARLEQNDRLLELARSSDKKGDYTRALRHYDEIVAKDVTGKVRKVLASEIDLVRKKVAAVEGARALATEGRHKEAFDLLVDAFESANGVMLPFQVTSVPPGAAVRVSGGAARTTPFIVEGTFADEWTLTFELDGFEPKVLKVSGPQTVSVLLSRDHERALATGGRIEALPAPIGEDHIVVDRTGAIARIGAGGATRWQVAIQTLSGMARAPVEMPGRPGRMLFVTETGAAWVLDPEDGSLEGPWELGSPPVLGPATVGDEVLVVLRSGKVARWRASLRPTLEDVGSTPPLSDDFRFGATFGANVAYGRGRADGAVDAPTGRWHAEVGEDAILVTKPGDPSATFPVAKRGAWSYLAWTPPAPGASEGRLWIADEAGVRAVLP
ncbi:MAG: DUF4388 domain-containing protein [Planctomycetota bacterium]